MEFVLKLRPPRRSNTTFDNISLRHRRDVAREVAFYVHQHNNIVPMRVLAGATPAETLYRDGGKNSSEAVAEILNSRRIERIAENQSGFCQICL